jgi:hypothetical protein
VTFNNFNITSLENGIAFNESSSPFKRSREKNDHTGRYHSIKTELDVLATIALRSVSGP